MLNYWYGFPSDPQYHQYCKVLFYNIYPASSLLPTMSMRSIELQWYHAEVSSASPCNDLWHPVCEIVGHFIPWPI